MLLYSKHVLNLVVKTSLSEFACWKSAEGNIHTLQEVSVSNVRQSHHSCIQTLLMRQKETEKKEHPV